MTPNNVSPYDLAMALHELSQSGLSPVAPVAFSDVGVRERADLQRVLRDRIEIIAPGVLIIAEEFSDWEDSKRRIDLLGLDRSGTLVVIELKRTSDGGHMELQALRYAAMISALTFDRLVEIYGDFLTSQGRQDDAMQGLLDHLDSDPTADPKSLDRVRIILVSADFSREVTTTVLWLNDQGIDITCVRLAAYDLRGTMLVDVQQVIPLPEAKNYMVRIREKKREARVSQLMARDFTKFRVTCGGQVLEGLGKGRAILAIVRYLGGIGVSPADMEKAIGQKRQRFFKVSGDIGTEDDFLESASEVAEETGQSFDDRRWFTGEGDLLHYGGDTYAFSNQWGKWTEQKMQDLVQAHGDGKVCCVKL